MSSSPVDPSPPNDAMNIDSPKSPPEQTVEDAAMDINLPRTPPEQTGPDNYHHHYCKIQGRSRELLRLVGQRVT